MEKIMAVITKEKQYAKRFAWVINERDDLAFSAVAFGDMEEYKAFEHKEMVKLILCDKEIIIEEGENCFQGRMKDGKLLIALTGGVNQGVMEGAETEINKYQSADEIVRQILEENPECRLMHDVLPAKKNRRVTGVFSPVARCGKTGFSLALAMYHSVSSKTLLLNFAEFSGFDVFLPGEYTRGLSDALYALEQDNLNEQVLSSLVYKKNGLDYIPPVRFAEDLFAVGGETWKKLVEEILKNSIYENIVIDTGAFSTQSSELFDICDVIYMPYLEDRVSMEKIRDFEDYMEKSGRTLLKKKIRKIKIPFSGEETVFNESVLYGETGNLIYELERGNI